MGSKKKFGTFHQSVLLGQNEYLQSHFSSLYTSAYWPVCQGKRRIYNSIMAHTGHPRCAIQVSGCVISITRPRTCNVNYTPRDDRSVFLMIDPYFWQNPFNVLITGLEQEEALNACDPYFWRMILIFGKAQKVTKTASPGHKNDFFHQNNFFSRVHTLDSCFFAKKRTHFGQVQPPEPCVEKKPAYRGSPPCTIFLTSSEQRNIVQLCSRSDLGPIKRPKQEIPNSAPQLLRQKKFQQNCVIVLICDKSA